MKYFKCYFLFLSLLLLGCEPPDLSSTFERFELADSSLSEKVYFITEHRGLSYEQTYITLNDDYCAIDTLSSISLNGTMTGCYYKAMNDTLFIYTRSSITKYPQQKKPVIVIAECSTREAEFYEHHMNSLGIKYVNLRERHPELLKCVFAE